MSGWVAVDLDGTLAEYHGWPSDGSIGKPTPPSPIDGKSMVDRVKEWIAAGVEVRVFTARAWPFGTAQQNSPELKARLTEAMRQIWQIEEWCIKHIGVALPCTCCKDYGMIELWDDRAVQVIPNTGARADGK